MPLRKLTIAEISTTLALAALLCVFVGLCSRTAAYGDYEWWGYDFLVNHGPADNLQTEIVIVDFDNATFESIKEYPIPRHVFAEVIASVSASSPKVVGLDMFLAEPRSAEDDNAMSKALAQAGNVVLASQTAAGGVPAVRPLSRFCAPEFPQQDGGDCKDVPSGAAAYAPVNLPIESDGFVRSFFLFAGQPRNGVSFPVMIAQLATQQPLKPINDRAVSFLGRKIPTFTQPARPVLIGTWCANCIRHVSAISLLTHPGVKNSDLSDKIVLIGQSNDAARDLLLTPPFRAEPGNGPRTRLSGVELHAEAIETLLSGNAVAVVSPLTVWAAVFSVCVVSVFFLVRYPLRAALPAICGLILILHLTAQALYSWGHIWFPYTTAILAIACSIPVTVAYRFVRERLLKSAALQEREELMGLFSRYVSADAAQEIWERRNELVLAGEERVATVLFSDIRSFTALTAGKDSRVVLQWLNEYLGAMDKVIRANGGFLNKFIGDGLMVLFGVPLSDGVKADACRAVRCAQQMLESVEHLNVLHESDTDFPKIKIGIGLHTGNLTCGNIGSKSRLEYSVIGETVNLASRLESLTKEFHTGIVLSSATYSAVKENFSELFELGEAQVRGFEDRVRLYGVSTQRRAAIAPQVSSGGAF
jgi:adenylate cyclase